MDACTLVDTMLHVAGKLSTSTTDLKKLVVKLFVLGLRYVDRKALWEYLFGPDEFVDWSQVGDRPDCNVLGDLNPWLALLAHCHWEVLAAREGEIAANYPALQVTRKNLKACNLDPGGPQSWTMSAGVLLMTLVRGLPSLHTLEMITCGTFKRNTHQACMQLLALSADVSYTPEQTLEVVAFVLGHVQVMPAPCRAPLPEYG